MLSLNRTRKFYTLPYPSHKKYTPSSHNHSHKILPKMINKYILYSKPLPLIIFTSIHCHCKIEIIVICICFAHDGMYELLGHGKGLYCSGMVKGKVPQDHFTDIKKCLSTP